MITVAIVDDDIKCGETLKGFLEQFAKENGVQFDVNYFQSPEQFLNTFKGRKYSVIFMDIEMPGIDGMTTARFIRKHDQTAMLFFVTNFAQFAIEGYEVQAFDFILKPVTYYNFALKMKRAIASFKQARARTLCISSREGKKMVETSSIKYVEVIEHEIVYHTTQGNYTVTTETLKQVEQKLKDLSFVLCNRCYLVNLKYVTGIKKCDVYIGDEVLRISEARRKDFIRALNNYCSSEA